ncbi:MAG: Nif3-like dinuclear metal center hexameric protein [Treponema sp.]|jgi:dinuclear metal center YbgI/SA1388 family protein|nr:Nif3-like dinuclear metal center hexameric protein [Treponema sp.]
MGTLLSSAALDAFFREILDIEGFTSADDSLNGIQVDNSGAAIGKIAFAVDAALETFKRAAAVGAGMIFVHHGLFWGKPLRLRGSHRERIKFLLDHDIALYAVHLPLDQHPTAGNNAALARLLNIEEPEAFGLYHGKKIGYKGKLAKPLSVEEAVKRISFMGRPPLTVLPFGKAENATAAVISGGAAYDVSQAIDEGVDLYVTGEAALAVYHNVQEAGINFIAGGHYSTEVWGVRCMMERCASSLNIDTEFIDLPVAL